MIFIILFGNVFFKVTGKTILISPLTISIKIKPDVLWIDKIIIFFMIVPVHNLTVITLPFSTILFKHCAVWN
ncbi:hypothetical protein A9F05_09385 [Lactiplantibacillus plantarum]|nr:hypothetical protein A9F05_09385 [Lactiplantibacillus plantarum]